MSLACNTCKSRIKATERTPAKPAVFATTTDPETGKEVRYVAEPPTPADTSLDWTCGCDGAKPIEVN